MIPQHVRFALVTSALGAASVACTPSTREPALVVTTVQVEALPHSSIDSAAAARRRVPGEQTLPLDSLRPTSRCPMPVLPPDSTPVRRTPVVPPDSFAPLPGRMPNAGGDCDAR